MDCCTLFKACGAIRVHLSVFPMHNDVTLASRAKSPSHLSFRNPSGNKTITLSLFPHHALLNSYSNPTFKTMSYPSSN